MFNHLNHLSLVTVPLSKSKIFIFICISFSAGIGIASVITIDRFILFAWLAAACTIFAVCFGRHRKTALLALFLFFAGSGAWRLSAAVVQSEYQDQIGSSVQIEGYIVAEPDVRQDRQYLAFRPDGHRQNIQLFMPLYAEYAYGDRVVVKGKLAEAKVFEDFDYRGYLQRFNIFAVMNRPQVLVLKSGQGNPVIQGLLAVKHAFAANVAQKFREPHGSLLLGILIGAKKAMPQPVLDDFAATGTSHIVAVSGYNISVIVMALGYLAYAVGRRWSFAAAAVFIIGFVIISGASASVVRAAVMGSLLMIAMAIGRQYAVGPAMFGAAACMLFINPKILFYDIGFQLSFAATMGIVYFMPLLERLTEHWPKLWTVKSNLLVTLSATAATLPLSLAHFGLLSIVAPLVNVLVLPIVPYAMLYGFLSAVPIAGTGFAFVTSLVLTYILTVITWFARLPFSHVQIATSGWVAALLYGVLVLIYFSLRWMAFKRAVKMQGCSPIADKTLTGTPACSPRFRSGEAGR